MFSSLKTANADPILTLMKQARLDPNQDKVDLTIGVYFDDHGQTPVMRAVKEAEARRNQAEITKTYLGLDGDVEFSELMRDVTLAGCVDSERVAKLQTPGGSGAICIVSEITRYLTPDATIWASNPSYYNHIGTFGSAGQNVQMYPYLSANQRLDFDGMMARLEADAKANDLLILHACCHNPSGVNFTLDQWQVLTDFVNARGVVPFIDIAYQGLGQGMDEDAQGMRLMLSHVENAFVAFSCSKNFGLYRERIGGLLMVCKNAAEATAALSSMHQVGRRLYSMPPHHGAELVKTILKDDALKADWNAELTSYRNRVNQVRVDLAASLKRYTNSDDFAFIAQQSGMFSLLPLSMTQIDSLREEHSIYLVPNGEGFARANLAACALPAVDTLAEAVAKVL